ncbi:phospholipase D-like domain-containing protein, partial [Priestia megaterium]|uniref:phospholipase D-like domain-containing protein n=1 Tax=Priestia megaterium TaxID=1404 RepID=UPI0021C10C26
MITTATNSISISTPYFLPNQPITTPLPIAPRKRLQLPIILPEINHPFLTQYPTTSYFPQLLRSRIQVYSYTKPFFHQK